MSAPCVIDAELLRATPLPRLNQDGDKDDRGRVLIIAGSPEVPGAALLAGIAALRAGAGKLQIATAASIAPHLGLAVPEALVIGLPEAMHGVLDPTSLQRLTAYAERSDAILVGPGILDEEAARDLVRCLLDAADGPLFVLDAGALARLPEIGTSIRRQGGRIVVTPHAGEMATLLGIDRHDVTADPLSAARCAASLLHAVVALKGSTTHVVSPQGEAWTFAQGRVGLATSGSGDALAGIIAGLLARGASPVQAAVWGVYLHGEAGNCLSRTHGEVGYLARELLDEVSRVAADLTRL